MLFVLQKSDLLGLMIEAGDGESKVLSEGEIIADSVGFLIAGYETTSSALTFTTGLLASHPDIQERLAEEIKNYFSENPVCATCTLRGRFNYWVLLIANFVI